MSLTAGFKLGPYEIVSAIGAGGMGEVYRARDTRLDRIVAVKVSKQEFTERFEREARAVGALNHPHICQLYDVGPNYLVMGYVEGTPLKGPLPLDKTLDYAGQIAAALDAAHTHKVTHRDLKPANILVTKSAGVKLLDFGLAKIDQPVNVDGATLTMGQTAKGTILGTVLYMSPEQVNGVEAGPRSDIFSFGVVLYEMITGKRAFEGATPASVIGAILERPAPSIADVAPPALDQVLKRCLEKDPENRWQTARDLRAALALVAQASAPAAGLPKPSAPAGWPEDWSRDGRFIIYQIPDPKTGQDLWVAPLPAHGADRDRKPFPYLHSEFDERHGRFSPDGRWVAYTSNESGRDEVYVQSLPLSVAKIKISASGGMEPQWRKDGKELFYISDEGMLMGVSVKLTHSASEIEVGEPKRLIPVPMLVDTFIVGRSYEVSNDGQRFLVRSLPSGTTAPPLTVVLNWQAGLK